MLLIEREMVRLILSCVGVSPKGIDGLHGLTLKKNAVDADVTLTFSDNLRQSIPVWSGQTSFGLKGCVCEILDKYNEYYFIYKLKDQQDIIGLGHVYDNSGLTVFKKYKDGKWENVPLREQLIISAEFVSLADSGVIWKVDEDFSDLVSKLKELILL